jgi:RNAse (barnase) inhibitor barstar
MINTNNPKSIKTFTIDGNNCINIEAFYDELKNSAGLTCPGRNLNALNDVLRGGFGLEPPFHFIFKNSRKMKKNISKWHIILEIFNSDEHIERGVTYSLE